MDEKKQAEYINDHFFAFHSDNAALAIALGEKARALAQKNRWTHLEAQTRKNLGVAYYLEGDYPKALLHYQMALDLFTLSGDPSGQGQVLKEMGNYFKKFQRFDKALEQLEQAIAICTEVRDTHCIAAALDIKGVVYIEQGRFDEAEAIFKKELALQRRLGDEKALSYTWANLAEVAIAQGNFKQAEDFLSRSTEIRKRLGDRIGVAININNTGEMFLRSGQPENALPYFQKTVEETERIGFADLQRHAMQMLSETHAALGQHQEAIGWLNRSYALKDSLFNLNHSQQIAEMAEKYEAVKKEKELALRQRQLQKRNMLLGLSIAGLVLLVVAFILVFRYQKQRRIQWKRETELKTELIRSELSLRLQNERLRISRDLHDNLGAELTIVGGALSKRAHISASMEERSALETIAMNIRQAMALLRESIWAIRYEQFSLQSLSDKISDFAARASSLPLLVSIPEDDISLSPAQTLNLFRIAQEAIANSIKYSEASRIELSFLLKQDQQLSMVLSDNGRGFDPEALPAGNGLGNMRFRAEELGGSLEVESAPNEGTQIRVSIPLHQKQDLMP
ncbi:MAG: sensor histidine kinase [Haliscomenobacter sp.]|nr:sensor histidine kinase [Haliscomenobacter sp.]